LYRNHLQAEGHPVIEFVLSDDDVVLAHRRVEGMNFIPGGYSYPEWGVANPGDENQMIGGTDEFASSSNPHVTRSSAGGQGTGPSSMLVDLRMAPQVEVIQRVSLVGQPQVTPAGGINGPPSPDPQGQTLMEHDGQETDSVSIPSPATQRSPSPNFMEAPPSSAQILVSSGQSRETPTAITEGLQQIESLTLQQGTDSADVSREHTLVHAEARPATAMVVTRTFSDGQTDRRSDDGRGGVRDLDAL
jgi:hypothetical protein